MQEAQRLQEAAMAAAAALAQNGKTETNRNGTLDNGVANKAADYYVRGELPTELTQRKVQK